ncbi:hypothetical protein LQW54_002549 [Pestalotiopsis sp. IQ-011]
MIDFEQKYQQFINGTSRDSATQVELVAKALRTLTDTLVDDAFAHVTGWVKPNELNDMATLWNNLYLNTWGLDGFIVSGLTNLHADLCDNLTAMSINFKMFNETTHASMTAPTALQMIPNADGTTRPEWFTEIGEEIIGANWIFGTINRAIDRCNSYVNATVGQNETVPAGQSLDPIIDTVFKLLFKFEQKYQSFMEGHHDTHGQAEIIAFKALDLVQGFRTAASSVKAFTGNVSSDDLTHLEKSYNDASRDTKTYLNNTDYVALPKYLEQRVCDRVQDAGTKFDDFASAVAAKLNEAVKNATSDIDNLQLSVDRIMGRSDAIYGGLNHAASKCYSLLNTNQTTSAPATTNSTTAASTTTLAGNIPGQVIVSVHNTVTGPCSCGRGLTPRAAANADSDDDPVTSTWFNPNPMTSAAVDASMVTIRISDTVTVPCVCETATAHHHGHHDDETTTTTRHHSTTVTASPTSTGSAAVVNVDGPSLWLVVAHFLFLLCLPSVWAWAILRRLGV